MSAKSQEIIAKTNAHNSTTYSVRRDDLFLHVTFVRIPLIRGYSERQKIMAAHVEGQFAEVFFTPINLGGGCHLVCTATHLALTRLIDKYRDSLDDLGS
ncbi:unnamed protein product, partial [Choristocarpus tenellus]